MYTLKTKKENKKAIALFQKRLKGICPRPEKLEWGFPNGERAKYLTYKIATYLGEIQIGVPEPESWRSRIPHLVRFSKEQGPPSPDVELNIPIDHNRKVSGLYASSNGEIWLCSRGSFTAYRGQIKRDITFSYFDKWLNEIDDAGKIINVIPVCSLSSPTFANDIATFVAAVLELKELYKKEQEAEQPTSRVSPFGKVLWGIGKEYEGTKQIGRKESAEYEYLHGPLCNQLKSYLEEAVSGSKITLVTKNVHIDVALVSQKSGKASAIFEVKTAALPSNQIYTAVGQVLYYRNLYGDAGTKLYLVLPLSSKSTDTEEFAQSISINILYGDSGKFVLSNGRNFKVPV